MKQILFFLLLSATMQAQPPKNPVPISEHEINKIIGEDLKISYITDYKIIESDLFNTALRVLGKFEGGRRFIVDFAGVGTLAGWEPSGEAELCIGINYCDFDFDGCKGRCKYYYFQLLEN